MRNHRKHRSEQVVARVVPRDVGRNPDWNGLSLRNRMATATASIADNSTVNLASSGTSRRMISTPKNTPVIGALNVAAIPPRATRTRIRLSGVSTHCHRLDASADRVCTIGRFLTCTPESEQEQQLVSAVGPVADR